MGAGTILVMNAGSSSLKYELFEVGGGIAASGEVSRVGSSDAESALVGSDGVERRERAVCPDHGAAATLALEGLRDRAPAALGRVAAVGHRVVHGGAALAAPTVIDDEILSRIEAAAALAPLHNGPAAAVIRWARSALPDVPHVAAFDTGFHHDLPPVAQRYALPDDLLEPGGLRRYGFHGISCAYLMGRIEALDIVPRRRVLLCHLGAGASITAVLDGRSIDTSMGLTPLEGLVMGTRSGDVDPGLLFHLLRDGRMDASTLQHRLEHDAGLKGLSGGTADYRALEQRARDGDSRADAALELFAYRARKYLGAYWAALGGVDLIVFAGGIGENSADARDRIVGPMAAVGWQIDAAANADGPPERSISPPDEQPAIWVIPTRETLQIAEAAAALIAGR